MESFEFLNIPERYSNLDIINYQYFNNLLNHRTIVFNSEVDDTILESIMLPLMNFEKDDSDEPITLIINTDGGDVINSMPLLNIIDNYKKRLNIICFHAFSMGANIMCAGKHNPNVKKYCYPYSYLLFHNGQSAVAAEARTVEDFINFYKKLDENIGNYIVSHTNIPKEEYETFDRKQVFLDSKKMLLYGIVDEIIGEAKLHDACKQCNECYNCEKAYQAAQTPDRTFACPKRVKTTEDCEKPEVVNATPKTKAALLERLNNLLVELEDDDNGN